MILISFSTRFTIGNANHAIKQASRAYREGLEKLKKGSTVEERYRRVLKRVLEGFNERL